MNTPPISREFCKKHCRGTVHSCPGGLIPQCPYANKTHTLWRVASPGDPLRVIFPLSVTRCAAPLVEVSAAAPPVQMPPLVPSVPFATLPGDAFPLVIGFARALKDAGHIPLPVCPAQSAAFVAAQKAGLSPLAVPLDAKGVFTRVSLFFRLLRLVKSFQPHVVHCPPSQSVSFWKLCKTAGYPLAVVTADVNAGAGPDGHAPAFDAMIQMYYAAQKKG